MIETKLFSTDFPLLYRNEIFPKKMVDTTNPMGYYIGKIWKKGGGQA